MYDALHFTDPTSTPVIGTYLRRVKTNPQRSPRGPHDEESELRREPTGGRHLLQSEDEQHGLIALIA